MWTPPPPNINALCLGGGTTTILCIACVVKS